MNDIAHVKHRVTGRMRLCVAERRGDVEYYTHVARSLSQLPRVTRVECNPATGSILILHEGGVEDSIVQSAEAQRLFTLGSAGAGTTTMAQNAGAGLRLLDDRLKNATRGDLDLRSVILGGFVTMGIVQLSRGHIMGPAVTLFWYAYQLMAKSNDAKK
jgi:hypothetical protein